ncbi:MAG: ankyrin repeat domain-containing protein [Minicystis sp.]
MIEAEQLWREIVDWWTANGAGAALRAKRPGATKRAITSAEKRLGHALPGDLAAILLRCDGGPSFDGYDLLSLADIVDTWSTWGALLADGKLKGRPIADPGALRRWWSPAWLPFAKDACGNLECIDLGTARPRRIRLEVQDAQGAYALAGSFTSWLRTYRDRLRSGELAVDAEGFVSEKPVLPAVIDEGPKRPELAGKDLARVHAALKRDDPEGVLAVLDGKKLGPDVSLEYDRSLLGAAAEQRRTKVLRALLDRGADIDAADDNGRTPLFWAAWGPKSDPALVKLLLARGADPNRRTKYDGTPLHSAIIWEDAEVVAAMIAAGADPSVPDASGRAARASAAGKKWLLDALGGHASPTVEHVRTAPPNKPIRGGRAATSTGRSHRKLVSKE